MTVRNAELTMALVTILISLGLMWSSTDGLAIGWVPGAGPGSGFWPFWLSLGMLICALATLVRWFLRATPESRSTELYMSRTAVVVVGTSAAALLALLVGIHLVGIYISLVLFLLAYLKLIGRHDWAITVLISAGMPVLLFALFEWGLQIPLPKAFTEEWFYPVYDLMYGTDYFWAAVVACFAVIGLASFAIHAVSGGRKG